MSMATLTMKEISYSGSIPAPAVTSRKDSRLSSPNHPLPWRRPPHHHRLIVSPFVVVGGLIYRGLQWMGWI
jgi:hypothetical protein